MRKHTTAILIAITAFSLAGCGSGQNSRQSTTAAVVVQTENAGTEAQTMEQAEDKGLNKENGDRDAASGRILVAYFSVMETDGVDTVAGASRVAVDGKVLGNCQYIAELIHQSVGGDLFSIETVQEYPGTHQPLLDFAWEEKAENARPELADHISNLEDYDTIFLGYPNWNADLPMPLYSFLEEYDFSGKTIIPFSTHGGSGFSRTVSTIAELEPGAEVLKDGLSISRNSVAGAAASVEQWIQGLNLLGE